MRQELSLVTQSDLRIVSRRTILGGGVALLALGLTPSWSTSMKRPGKSELFVFQAPASGNPVVAVAFPEGRPIASGRRNDGSVVRIHAGPKSWTVAMTSNGGVSEIADGRLFVGKAHFSSHSSQIVREMVVIEASSDLAPPGESLDVWAEILGDDGSRLRIGSPVVAEIMARNPKLSEIYHQIAPDQDQALLAEPVAAHLASVSLSATDPAAHGRRLASLLLPDVIKYDRQRPVGFNFADRNGRHPADAVETVVKTLLAGAVSPGSASETTKLGNAFPYFSTSSGVTS